MPAASRLAYFARTAVHGIRSSPLPSAIAVMTIGVSLVLVGAFSLLLSNMEDLLHGLGEELHIAAFLDPGMTERQQAVLQTLVTTVEGVDRVRVVSEEEALERFRAGVGQGAGLLEGLEENPLPASLEIVLMPAFRSPEGLRIVVEQLDGLAGISDVSSGSNWVEGYMRAVALVRGLGIGLTILLALAALLIVGNTIRLAIYARRDELEILGLVGASRGFVITPFLLEGLVQGVVGGGLAMVLLLGLFQLALPGVEAGLTFVLGGSAPRFFTSGEVVGMVSFGAGLGLFGSAAAVSAGWKS